MKLAIIGSRGLWVEDLGAYLPPGVTELVSGGAKGIDTCAREYALSHGLKLTEFLPDYRLYGRAAPLVRNREIVAYPNSCPVRLMSPTSSSKPLNYRLKE